MKMHNNLIGMLLLMPLFGVVHAQRNIKPLRIGDTIPDIELPSVSLTAGKTTRFSDLKGKLVILDFWFGACPSCIESFPKMEALQEKFKDRIQVLMVNYESQQKIDATFERFRKKSSIYRNPRLPSIVNDTLFHQLFPHQYYPHEVWIDANCVVLATTGTEEVTEKNIQALLEGKQVAFDMKVDNLNFDDSKAPILKQVYADYPNHLRYYSAILDFIPGISGGLTTKVIDSATGTIRVSRRNMSILSLLGNALAGGTGGDPFLSPDFDFGKRVILNVGDSSKYFFQEPYLTFKDWQKKNCFSYEAVMPLESKDHMFQTMLGDLEQYFGVHCRVVKRRMACLALSRTSGKDRIHSKGKSLSLMDRDTSKYQLYAGTTQWFLDKIATVYKGTPYVFVDNTHYKERIDIELDNNVFTSVERLRKALRKKYDLDLVATEQEVEVLVLEEKKCITEKGLVSVSNIP